MAFKTFKRKKVDYNNNNNIVGVGRAYVLKGAPWPEGADTGSR